MIAWEIFSYGVVQGNCWSRLNCKKSYQKRSIFSGARFHSGLHRSTEIGQSFFRMTQEHRKGDLSLPPLTMLEVIKWPPFSPDSCLLEVDFWAMRATALRLQFTSLSHTEFRRAFRYSDATRLQHTQHHDDCFFFW